MAQDPVLTKIKASLSSYKNVLPHSSKDRINIEYEITSCYLEISLRRTIRIPDNGKSYGFPPGCGAFPIYSVDKFETTLPEDIVTKGGLFIPIYQREAMWINFRATRPFAVKVFLGGINAVSGESSNENMCTHLRRNNLLSKGKSIQDYIVPPHQEWLDGVAKKGGNVMQFVATPMGSGYSVEAQLTGDDSVGGLQFEVIPLKFKEVGSEKPSEVITITVKSYAPEEKEIHFKFKTTTFLAKLFDAYCEKAKLNCKAFRFLYDGNRIDSTDTCDSLDLEDGDVIEAFQEQVGGGGPCAPGEMSLAPGGLIKQAIVKDKTPADQWDVDSAVLVNVQLINAAVFKSLTGMDPPETPISATTYAKHGYPFYEIYEEPSEVEGGLRSLKSVADLDKEKKQNLATQKAEKDLKFPIVTLAGTKRSFVPLAEMEKTLKKVRVANNF